MQTLQINGLQIHRFNQPDDQAGIEAFYPAVALLKVVIPYTSFTMDYKAFQALLPRAFAPPSQGEFWLLILLIIRVLDILPQAVMITLIDILSIWSGAQTPLKRVINSTVLFNPSQYGLSNLLEKMFITWSNKHD